MNNNNNNNENFEKDDKYYDNILREFNAQKIFDDLFNSYQETHNSDMEQRASLTDKEKIDKLDERIKLNQEMMSDMTEYISLFGKVHEDLKAMDRFFKLHNYNITFDKPNQ